MPVALSMNILRTNDFNVYPLRTLRLCGEQEVMGLLRPSQKLRTGLTHPTLADTKTIENYISVSKKTSRIKISLTPAEITFGEPLTITGSISLMLKAEVTLIIFTKNSLKEVLRQTTFTISISILHRMA